jgi:hypothetical protein
MCPDCLVLMVEQDGGWFCPYALAARANSGQPNVSTNVDNGPVADAPTIPTGG